tara:strand:+ start:78 stop:755 length:678 start_codon:yes stop_codon:yes gene_type:complete
MENLNIKIHKEGYAYIIITSIFSILFIPFFPLIGLIFILITLFIIVFFRDPNRIVPVDDFILSPADGVITFIGETKAPNETGIDKNLIKISIFLNIFNVHVNRVPTLGKVKNIIYIPGKFLSATLNKSSEKNERNIVVIQKKNLDTIIVSQIAGLIARRIICDLKINENLLQGDKLGIIKFGSRVDLYLPTNYKILVSLGQKVVGGETIISNPKQLLEISDTQKK